MKRIAVLGDIGSGKSYVAKNFGYPVFNADENVGKLYKRNKKVHKKLKKILPKYFNSFPISKNDIIKAILANKNNLKKITRVVHFEIRKEMNIFLKINRNKKIVVLDIPLLVENKINRKNDILIFVNSKKSEILKRLKKRPSFNKKILKIFKDIQLPLDQKKRKSKYIINNNFTKKSVKKEIQLILNKIL